MMPPTLDGLLIIPVLLMAGVLAWLVSTLVRDARMYRDVEAAYQASVADPYRPDLARGWQREQYPAEPPVEPVEDPDAVIVVEPAEVSTVEPEEAA